VTSLSLSVQQHLLHQRPAGQADMDVHLRRLLRHHGVHPVLPQLPDLVLPGPRHDHLHRVVPRHRRAPQRPGEPPPHSHRHRIRSLLSTTDSASPSSSPTHMQAEGVAHSGPTKLVLYFTGATNILYTFGGHAVTV
jgi:hypothetical protein